MSTRTIELHVDEESGRRLKDPSSNSIFHFETYLPFSEAAKLEPGNANVRPAKETYPFKRMKDTAEDEPETFHLKNRGITYLCDKFKYDNQSKKLVLVIPNLPKSKFDDDDSPRFGIADGGHTFRVVEEVAKDLISYKETPDWTEPFVRVHFLASENKSLDGIEDVVEALNTSTQVKKFSLQEYQGHFDELKKALTASKFDIAHVAFTENQDEKEWQVLEIVQRMACFLKERWKIVSPSSMYRSKDKALQLFLADTGGEFKRLYPVIKDVITFPEFIQSTLSENIEGRRFDLILKKNEQRGVH